jgi:hypothetical protein
MLRARRIIVSFALWFEEARAAVSGDRMMVAASTVFS